MLYKIKVVFKIGAHVLPSLACEIVTWCPRGVLLGTWYSNTNTWFISILNFSSTFKTVIPMLLDAKEYENELLSFIKISIIHTFKMLKRLLWFVGFWRVLCLFWSAKCGITSRNLRIGQLEWKYSSCSRSVEKGKICSRNLWRKVKFPGICIDDTSCELTRRTLRPRLDQKITPTLALRPCLH